MCAECHREICPSGCPNAPEPEAVYECSYCGDPIEPGDEYVEIDGEYYHREGCIEDVALQLLYEKCGLVTEVA